MASMFASHAHSCFKILMAQLVSRGEASRSWLGHEEEALMNGMCALVGELPESSLAPSTEWGHSEKTAMDEPGRSHETSDLPGTWSWTSSLKNHEKSMSVVDKQQSVVFWEID